MNRGSRSASGSSAREPNRSRAISEAVARVAPTAWLKISLTSFSYAASFS
jgi:hypothetical protein